jgi:F-type H+-transporting ATPase subunit a
VLSNAIFAADLKKAFPKMGNTMFRRVAISLIFSALGLFAYAQAHGNPHTEEKPQPQKEAGHAPASHPEAGAKQVADPHAGHNHGNEAHSKDAHSDSHGPCGHSLSGHHEFNAGENAVHHISDANAIHVFGDLYFPLPCFLYAPGHGWTVTTTSSFHPHHHGNGEQTNNGYVLVHGAVMRVKDAQFATGTHKVEDYTKQKVQVNGKEVEQFNAVIGGQCYALENKTTWDGGLVGGGVTGYYDFSITRNVFTMLLTCLVLFLLFRGVASAATRNRGQAPKGIQNFFEPFVTFIRDEVAKPNIGPKYEKYMPYLLSAFFFILGLNLIGQVPFFPGSANVTGNISITIILALITFIISTFSANRHFWEHTLWMPGVPAVLKVLILTPIEILGLFLKPFTLLLRLFANITAGHIVILSFVSLIFILGKSGESVGGATAGIFASVPLTLFMMTLELLVAFLQAFIFTMLSATYIGAAIEEPHHH